MTKPLLHFTHGNSFPAGVYSRFLDGLREHYDVRVSDMVGHDPAYLVSDGWPGLVDELSVQLASYATPAILVGHSLGGMLSLMAARKNPALARCVVMLDSPVVTGWRAFLLRHAKRTGWVDKFSPARASQKRRMLWPDAAAAYAHFAAKDIFKAWAPGVLDDYIAHGLKSHQEGVQLRFDREVETAIYRALPHHLARIVKPPFPVPVGFIGGTRSVELRQAGLAATRKLVGANFLSIEGGHLFPMESPVEAGQLTERMISMLLAEGD
ncbi:MAG: alpha/beta hydrolase [Massilia sp.]|nr:alpha/beta hydrolase [Massilia sp.]